MAFVCNDCLYPLASVNFVRGGGIYSKFLSSDECVRGRLARGMAQSE